MNKKCIVLSLIVSFVAGSLLCPAHAQEAAKPNPGMKSVKIGVISPLSGPLTFIRPERAPGRPVGGREFNEKGTTGNGPGILVGNQRYKLEIVNYDDSGDPPKSVAGMRKLAEMYNVPVVLGPFGTPQVWARQEVNVGLKVLFNGLSTSDESRKKGNALYIQERVPGMYYGDHMAQACIDKGFKKAAVLTDINEAFESWGKRFGQKLESLGGQIVAVESADIKSTTDYHSIMTSFKAKNPDIIFISMYEEPGAWPPTTRSISVTKVSSSSPRSGGSRRKRLSVSTGLKARWFRRWCTRFTESIPTRTEGDTRPPSSEVPGTVQRRFRAAGHHGI